MFRRKDEFISASRNGIANPPTHTLVSTPTELSQPHTDEGILLETSISHGYSPKRNHFILTES
jgi:hypothetical protein